MSESGLINPQASYEPGLRGWVRPRQQFLGRQLRRLVGGMRDFMRNPLGAIGVISILVFTLFAVGQPLLMSTVWTDQIYDPVLGYDVDLSHPSPPSTRHFFGTDAMGRDVLSLLVYSAQTSFGVGLSAAILGSIIATVVGLTAAYVEGKVDTALMTISDAFILMPPAVMLLIIGLIFDLSAIQLGLLFGLFAGFGSLALLVKAHALSVKERQFVEAGRVSGRSGWKLVRTHILPHLTPLISVNMMFIVTGSVLIEALLAFLQRTDLRTSWGSMIWLALRNGMSFFSLADEWYVIVPPAIAIMLFCGGFYLVGRTLDEISNPRLKSQ